MLELLTSIIANGTTAFDMGYQPWIPFYNFIPILLVGAIVLSLWTRNAFWGVNLMVSSLISLFMIWGIWRTFDLTPLAVFSLWGISTAFSMWLQYFVIRERKRRILDIRAGEEHTHTMNDFDNPEDYREHIRRAHPDIWREYFEESEKE